MSLYFGNSREIVTIADAVPLYNCDELKSPTRSTIAMLNLLLHGRNSFDEIVGKLGMPADFRLFQEYTVRSPQGRGKPSHTDVMLLTETKGLAIEGKWTEPMYETVGAWMSKGPDRANRESVRDGWLSLLRRHCRDCSAAPDFDAVIYQMLHRAASAAVAECPSLAYFVFKPSSCGQSATSDAIATELSRLWNLLGRPSSFPFYVVDLEIQATDTYNPLKSLPKGQDSTAIAVCKALQGGHPLFTLAGYGIRRVGDEGATR